MTCYTKIAVYSEIIEGYRNFKNQKNSYSLFYNVVKSRLHISFFVIVIQKANGSILAGTPCTLDVDVDARVH